MRQKTLIALAIVTAPILLAAIVVPSEHGTASKPADTGPVFPTLKDWIGGATKLTVTGATGSVTLTRTPPAQAPAAGTPPVEGWGLAEKGGYPVQDNLIRPLIGGLVALHTVEPKTERPKLYDRIDIEDPSASKEAKSKLIELDDANGASIVKLILGRRRNDPVGGGSDSIYVRKPDEARAWTAQPAFDAPTDALGWIDHKIIDLDPDKIKTVTLTPAGGKPLLLEREKAGDKLTVRDLPKDAPLKSDTPGSDIVNGFRYLDLLDVKPAAQVTGAATATAEIVTFDGLDVTVSLFDQPGGPFAEVAAKGEGDAAKEVDDIAKRTNGWAYRIAEQRAKLFESKMADLLTPPPPPPAPAGAVPPTPILPPAAPKPVVKPSK